MNTSAEKALSKVPEVTLAFWVIKIAATTLGETGGDAVSMSMNLGYLIGTVIFSAVFLAAVFAQIKAKNFQPFLYWATIIATTTVARRWLILQTDPSALGMLVARPCLWLCCSVHYLYGIER